MEKWAKNYFSIRARKSGRSTWLKTWVIVWHKRDSCTKLLTTLCFKWSSLSAKLSINLLILLRKKSVLLFALGVLIRPFYWEKSTEGYLFERLWRMRWTRVCFIEEEKFQHIWLFFRRLFICNWQILINLNCIDIY